MGLRPILAALVLALAACNAEEVAPDRLPTFVAASAAKRPALALVFGSGGPRGFAHIGVLKVLDENGIRPDLIVGSSVGAMVGALYAAGMSAADLEREAYNINVLEFFEFRMLGGGLSTGKVTQRWVNEHVGNQRIEALRIPLVIAATRTRDNALALFNHGDTGLAVRASSASPGQFEAVKIGAESYVDGDEASPVPIRAARSLGARVVIAVDVSAYVESTPPNVPRDWIDKDARRAHQVAAEAPAADVLLHPDIGYYAGHSVEYRKSVIAAAERYTREHLPAIRTALGQNSVTARIPAGEASR